MATTPNFNWSTPDNTGLVKNGALDIRTLGNAIDASMADLKGGTTGQVLAKATNTDMDFTWTTPSGGSNQFFAGKNKIINGDFGIWQRGTSFTPAVNTYVYCADRFRVVRDGSGTVTVSQQTFTPGTAPVSGYEGQFFFRYNQTVAGSGGTYSTIEQPIEDVRTFAGQTVTISFWAKADSARSFTPQFIQGFGSGGSTRVDTNGSSITLTTSWVRYTQTFTLPSIAGKTIGSGSSLVFVLNLALNTTQTLDFWGFQVEAGSTATDFQTATGTIQGELAACQRYYWQQATGTNQNLTLAAYQSTTLPIGIVQYPVIMRVTPTLSYVSGTNYYAIDITNSVLTFNDVANSLASNVASRLYATTGSSTAGYAGIIRTNNAAAAVGWSAEL